MEGKTMESTKAGKIEEKKKAGQNKIFKNLVFESSHVEDDLGVLFPGLK
jgi:hypothetical protein